LGGVFLHQIERSTLRCPVALPPPNDYNDHHDLLRLGRAQMSSQTWTVAEAKAKFSEIIERAMSEGPQTITRKGRTAAVVVGAEEWQRKTQRVGNLAEFFAASPLRGSGLKIRRLKERPRKINL
jgi:prevent-host-death family protein